MPNRSPGCVTCRKRKIRCDETRPACGRCATHGVTCPGYRTEQKGGVEFRDQTYLTVQRVRGEHERKVKCVGSGAQTAGSDSNSATSSTDEFTNGETADVLEALALLPTPWRCIDNAAANRVGLYNEFLNIYIPKDSDNGGVKSSQSVFYELIAGMTARSPALTGGMDALSLAVVGNSRKDQKLLTQAVSAYGKALRSLRKGIARQDSLCDDQLLASVSILATCELFDIISQVSTGWQDHTEGAMQLISARGPESLRSDLALILFTSARHGALCHSLIERKACLFARPSWLDVSLRTPIQDYSTGFHDLAVQLPGLLQRHDIIGLCTELSVQETDTLLLDCERLEAELRGWFLEFHTQLQLEERKPYTILAISEFPTFTSAVQDRTFQSAFRFPNLTVGYLHSVYWMCMHFLRRTVKELRQMRSRLGNLYSGDTDRNIGDDELLTYILKLCQCIPFFCEPMSTGMGHIGIFLPMRTAALYYRENGHWQYLKWIEQVKANVFTKGLSPPNVACPRGSRNQP